MKQILALSFLYVTFSAATADDSSIAHRFPAETAVFVEIQDPPKLLKTILKHPLRERIEGLPQYKAATSSQQYRNFLTMRKMVEIQLAMEWREAVETLTSRGIAAGFLPQTEGVAILFRGHDPEAMTRLVSKIVEMAVAVGNSSQMEPDTYRDHTWYKTKDGAFGLIDDVLIVVNNVETGRVMYDRLLDGDSDSLESNPRYQERQKHSTQDSTLNAFFDVDALRTMGVPCHQLNEATRENPVLEVLAGGIVEAMQTTDWGSAELTISADSIRLQGQIPHDSTGVSEEREYYFGPQGSGRSPQVPELPETIFTLSTWRDVSEMWLRADDLYNEPIVDGFAQANAQLTTLFGGNDFSEDILGAIRSEVVFIATRRDFSDVRPRPAIQLPAMALSLKFKDANKSAREFRRTYQSMVGFFNVLGAMEGRRQLELDMETLDGESRLFTASYVPEEGEGESTSADLIFNFEPSVGFNGDRFVVAGTKELARQLISSPPPVRDTTEDNTRTALNADSLKRILDDNREQLIAQNMLSDGNSREEAEAAIALLIDLVGCFKEATMNITPVNGALQVGLTVQLAE